MLGAIIGDIVGSRFEFNNHKSKEFQLFTKNCFATDDTIMTLAVAKAIMETHKLCLEEASFSKILQEQTIKYMREIGRKYPGCGYGHMFNGWIHSDGMKAYNSYGNGAAMRISAAGIYGRDIEDVCKISKAITEVTHNHKEGIKGAEATAVAVYMARNGSSKEEIHNHIEKNYYPLNFTIDDIRDNYHYDVTCQGTVPQAIKCFLEAHDFEDAIRTAVSLGGDSDTIAAITGSIAEVYYNIPDALREKALSYLDSDLRVIYNEWCGFVLEF